MTTTNWIWLTLAINYAGFLFWLYQALRYRHATRRLEKLEAEAKDRISSLDVIADRANSLMMDAQAIYTKAIARTQGASLPHPSVRMN